MMHLKTQCMTSTFDQMSAQITANPSDFVTVSEVQRPYLGLVHVSQSKFVQSVISTDPFLATHVNARKF